MKTALRTHNHKDNTITAEAGSVTMNQTSNQHVVRVVRKHLRWKTTILRKEINKMAIANSLHATAEAFISTNNIVYYYINNNILNNTLENHLCTKTLTREAYNEAQGYCNESCFRENESFVHSDKAKRSR